FLAKMALEAHWHAFHPDAIDQFIDEPHYDRIRNWARRGDNYGEWPFFSRTIFPQETLMLHPDTNAWVQAGFGFRLFLTKRKETFFRVLFVRARVRNQRRGPFDKRVRGMATRQQRC